MKDVAFTLYPRLTLLDLVGPLQVLNSMCERSQRFGTVFVAKDIGAVEVDVPLRLTPSGTFSDETKPSVVSVPGGEASAIRAIGDEELISSLGMPQSMQILYARYAPVHCF